MKPCSCAGFRTPSWVCTMEPLRSTMIVNGRAESVFPKVFESSIAPATAITAVVRPRFMDGAFRSIEPRFFRRFGRDDRARGQGHRRRLDDGWITDTGIGTALRLGLDQDALPGRRGLEHEIDFQQ